MNISQMFESKFFQQQLVLALAALLIFLTAGTFLFSLSAWYADLKLTQQKAEPIAQTSDITESLIANIPETHLFGQAKGDMPISNLQLQVTGIVKALVDGAPSKAYISIAGQPSKIYQVDDSLPYGVKVYDITSDAIILENDGHLEKLPLAREKLQFKAKAAIGE